MKRRVIQAVVVGLIVVVVAYYAPQIMQNETVVELVERFGYLGIFLISLVSGFNIIVPIPAVTFAPIFVELGLSYSLVIATMALGMTSGDLLGYAIGAVTRNLVSERAQRGRIARLVHWAEGHGKVAPYVLLCVYAMVAPGPNELIIIPMAFLGYRLKYIFPIVFVGNIFFVMWGAFVMKQLITVF